MIKKIHDTIRNFIRQAVHYIWSLFLSGLLTILPITITISLFSFSFKLLIGWLEPVRQFVPDFLTAVVPYAEIILVFSIIFLIGMVLKIFLVRSVIELFELLLFKLPLIRPLYSGIKQLVQAFSPQDQLTFKKVVLIQFPRPGMYSLGFLTSELSRELAPTAGGTFFNVFVPTTPNPTSGYFVIVPEHDITLINLTRQEAMALIISGGIIQPERFIKQLEQ